MRAIPLLVPDAFRLVTSPHRDERGSFAETFRHDRLVPAIGRDFSGVQVNVSTSRRNTLRGMHGVALRSAQAKLVSCLNGTALDVVLDGRLGSPTFGVWDSTVLHGCDGQSVFVAEGLLHGFLALTDDTVIQYVCSTEFAPGTQTDIDALDPDLGLPWPLDPPPLRSLKDAAAPGLREAAEAGLLPDYQDCLQLYRELEPSLHHPARSTGDWT